MTSALFALAGVLVGVVITSGFSFWATRRGELVRASIATRALDDELSCFSEELEAAVEGRWPTNLDPGVALAVWRERREDLVLWAPSPVYLKLGAVLRECARWADDVKPGDKPASLPPAAIESAGLVLSQVNDARFVLDDLAKWLWSEHEIFILVTAWKMTVRSVKRWRGASTRWPPPDPWAHLGSDGP